MLSGRFLARAVVMLGIGLGVGGTWIRAQEPAYFVTYSDVLEEPGSLEVASQNLYASPKDARPFYAETVELEYGVTAWYTAEVYLQGQSTAHDSTIFTGFRVENRFHPLRGEHWVNPVIYVEYEDHSQADKSFLEVTDHQAIQDQEVTNGLLRKSVERAVEGKLILSSTFDGLNVSENVIAEKNLTNEPWEFGYAVGASRSLASAGSGRDCWYCRRRLAAGGEIFGGLGTRYDFGVKGTSMYAGPTLAYTAGRSMTVLLGPEFGLNANSANVLWRAKVSYEFSQFGEMFRRLR
jgi:hypothetical protein